MASLARTFSSPFNSKMVQGAKKFMSLQASNAHKALTTEFQEIFRERNITRKRKKIVNEIIESEKTYQSHLSLLISLFLTPIKVGCLLPKKAIEDMFGNIEAIYSVNVQLLDLMENEDVATALYKLAPFMKLYSLYANNFELSNKTIEEYEKRDSEFLSFKELQESRDEMKGLKLRALLITPIQRIPRYKLLLESLLEKTTPEHIDYEKLRDACLEVSKVATHINECLRQHENFNKMLSIQNSFAGDGAPKILAPGRRFLREGILSKVCERGGSKERMFFLFNDMLIYAKKETTGSYACRGVFPLINCMVEQVMGGTRGPKDGGSLFKINCKGKTLLLYSTSHHTVRSWLRDIKDAIGELHTNLASLRRGDHDPFTPPDAALRRDSKMRRSKGMKELVKKNNPLSPAKINTCMSPRQDSLYPMRNDILPQLALNASQDNVLSKSSEPNIFTGCLNSAKKDKRIKPTLRRFKIDDSPPETPNMVNDGYSLRSRKRKLTDGNGMNDLLLSDAPTCSDSVKKENAARSSTKKMLIEGFDEKLSQMLTPGCFGSAKRKRFVQADGNGESSTYEAANCKDNDDFSKAATHDQTHHDDHPLKLDFSVDNELISCSNKRKRKTGVNASAKKVWGLLDKHDEDQKEKKFAKNGKFQAKRKVSVSRRRKRRISHRHPYSKAQGKSHNENHPEDMDESANLLRGTEGTFKYTQTASAMQGMLPKQGEDSIRNACAIM